MKKIIQLFCLIVGFHLNEGTRVNVLEKLNEWSLVELSNGSKGWILSSTFQTIK